MAFWIKGGKKEAMDFCSKLKVFYVASSIGGTASLIRYVYLENKMNKSDEERAKIGINDKLIRLSVGIEHHEDLTADLDQALGDK